MAEHSTGHHAPKERPKLNVQTDRQPAEGLQPEQEQDVNNPDAPTQSDSKAVSKPTSEKKKQQQAGKQLRGILKPLPPPNQTQRLNATLQSSFSNFKRDLFGGFMPLSPHASPASATAAPSSSSSQHDPHQGFHPQHVPQHAANPVPATQNVTLLNTNSNAGSSLWKTMSTRLTTLDPVQAATQLPLLGGAAPSPAQSLNVRGLRGVRFRMNCLTVTYPLGSAAPLDEGSIRDHVNASHQKRIQQQNLHHWTPQELVKFYDDCCRSREELGLQRIRNALLQLGEQPREMDLTGLQFNLGSAEALSDLLSIDFGLKKLILDSCHLDDECIKVILHALLVSGTLPTLSIANNRKIKAKGWQYVAIFLRRAKALRFLDLSENTLDKRTIDFIVQAITARPSSHPAGKPLESVPGDSASAPPDLRSQDHPLTPSTPSFLHPNAPLLLEPTPANPSKSHLNSLRLENTSLKQQSLELLSQAVRHPDAKLKHISLRRNKINPLGGVALAVMIRDYPDSEDQPHNNDAAKASDTPLSTLSRAFAEGNSVTSPARTAARPASLWESILSPPPSRPVSPSPQERFGSLLTLDVRSNDIRHGVTYIAQVLKRNKTLKVLNLCDNKIDSAGLVALAEALKCNRSLETLDLSQNPCCGPKLEGIAALRAAFSSNTSLLRVFLADTDLSSEGAIGLAEFLPDIRTLIHLDLTENFDIDIAGVMALAVSVKMNKTIRCLDLNIPPNDPDFARLSQDILQSCIRNTEYAQEESTARGIKQPVSAPFRKSAVARNLEEQKSQKEARTAKTRHQIANLLAAASQSRDLLRELLVQAKSSPDPSPDQLDILRDVLGQTRAAQLQLADSISGSKAAPQDAIELNQELIVTCNQAGDLLEQPTRSPSQLLSPQREEPLLHSPSFSITDSDDEDSDEEPAASTSKSSSAPITMPQRRRRASSESDAPKSPVESQSRNWVEEEGEVFRKKAFLDDQLDQEEDPEMTGEQMRQEILDTDVPRPPHREEGDLTPPLSEPQPQTSTPTA